MTDLKPEDRALIERVYGGFADCGTFSSRQLAAIIQAARAEGPRTDCHDCGTYDVIGPICAKCNPELAAMVRGEGLRSPSGGGAGEWISGMEGLPDQPKDLCGSRDEPTVGATAALAPDVVRLIIAARNVAFEDHPERDSLRELDAASEAFADRVPWDDQSDADPIVSVEMAVALAETEALAFQVECIRRSIEADIRYALHGANPETANPDMHIIPRMWLPLRAARNWVRILLAAEDSTRRVRSVPLQIDGGEAVHEQVERDRSRDEPKDSLSGPTGEVGGGLNWVRASDALPVRDALEGEQWFVSWCIKTATYDTHCIDGNWSHGETIDLSSSVLWAWLPVNPENNLAATPPSREA